MDYTLHAVEMTCLESLVPGDLFVLGRVSSGADTIWLRGYKEGDGRVLIARLDDGYQTAWGGDTKVTQVEAVDPLKAVFK